MPGDSDNDRHVFVLDGNNAEKMISLQFQRKRFNFRYDRKIPDYFSVAGAP